MSNKLNLTLVLGSAREGRVSEKVFSFVNEKAKTLEDVNLKTVDVADFLFGRTIPPWEDNEKTSTWKKIVSDSDAFVFVIPEYNHGYPGEFKILLDSAYEEYSKKPVLLVTVSDGPWGGARMAEHLKPILQNLGLIVLPKVLHTSFADKKFENGSWPEEEYQKQLNGLLKELVEYSRGLKLLREV